MIRLLLNVTLCLHLASSAFAYQDADPGLELDRKRSEKYIDELRRLSLARLAIREQVQVLEQKGQSLELSMRSAFIEGASLRAMNKATPFFDITPAFAQQMNLRFGQTRTAPMRPPGLGVPANADGTIWWMVQSNTMLKRTMETASMQKYLQSSAAAAQIASNTQTLITFANAVGGNFDAMRSKVDWLGRRSALEHQEALRFASDQRVRDPQNAGLALVQAAAHRTNGDFRDALRCIDEVDNLSEQLAVLHVVMRLQIEWIQGNKEQGESLSKEAIVLGREYGMVEPLLIRGWIALAEGDTDLSYSCAIQIRKIFPDYIEGPILQAWSMLLKPRPESRDASLLLQGVSAITNTNDWHYHQVLAFASLQRKQWDKADKEITLAIETAPSHLRSYLENQRNAMRNRDEPEFDVGQYLRDTWRIQVP